MINKTINALLHKIFSSFLKCVEKFESTKKTSIITKQNFQVLQVSDLEMKVLEFAYTRAQTNLKDRNY